MNKSLLHSNNKHDIKHAISNELFYIIISIAFIILVTQHLLSEKVPYNNGFGWDGVIYAKMIEYLNGGSTSISIDTYYIKRILPSLIISIPAKIFNLPVTPSYIINGFVFANIINMAIALFYWLKTTVLLDLSRQKALFGLLLLMFCFPVVKFHAYLPVLTDSFAYAVACAMMYYYLAGSQVKLISSTIIALFIWNGALYTGILLLFFPRHSHVSIDITKYARLQVITGITALIAIISMVLWAVFSKKYALSYPGFVTRFNWALLPFSIGFVCAYVWWVSRCSVNALFYHNDDKTLAIRKISFSNIMIVTTILASVLFLQKSISSGPGWSSLAQIGTMLWCSVKQPLIFFVAGTTYYGLTLPFMLLDLKGVLRRAHELGFGMMLSIIYGLALGLSTEPRFYINVLPLMILAVTLSDIFDRLSQTQWVLLVAVQIAFSKIWLTIAAKADDFEILQSRAAQGLFMNIGTWMSNQNYIYHLVATIVATTLVALCFEKSQKNHLSLNVD